jgi:hypothetical protein
MTKETHRFRQDRSGRSYVLLGRQYQNVVLTELLLVQKNVIARYYPERNTSRFLEGIYSNEFINIKWFHDAELLCDFHMDSSADSQNVQLDDMLKISQNPPSCFILLLVIKSTILLKFYAINNQDTHVLLRVCSLFLLLLLKKVLKSC